MQLKHGEPDYYDLKAGEALAVSSSTYGSVGRLFRGEGLEAVWVKKEAEEIDPGWFSQSMVDLILVVQGRLKVEFEQPGIHSRVLGPGEMIILPANMRCRAYRWPRSAKKGTIFLAVYPAEQSKTK